MCLVHGWGWDASGWEDWRRLAPAQWRLQVADRGYFGAKETVVSARIVVCHSFGLHLVDPAILTAASLVVVIGGFRRFHPGTGSRGQRLVRRMRRRLALDPQRVLDDFYTACFSPLISSFALPYRSPHAAATPDWLLLHNDLARLENDMMAAVPKGRVLLLHGGEDGIVALERAEELQDFWPNSLLQVLPGAGHALHASHADWCWERVMELWENR
jgi:pimeloyl-[acyl-carrier protein] methyl ester esterase